MNNSRRKQINSRIIELRRLIEEIESNACALEEIESEEQEYFDNIPENLSRSENAENSEAAIDLLCECRDELGGAVSAIEEAITFLEHSIS